MPQTLRQLCNIPPDKLLIMEMFLKGKKVAQDNLSEMTCQQLKQMIEIQEMLSREWTYKTINLKNDGR